MNRTASLVAASLLVGALTGPYLLESLPLFRSPAGGLQPMPTPQGKLESDAAPRGVESVRITPIVRAVRKAGPSVVNIQVGELLRVGGQVRFKKAGEGSGVIVSEEGLILTNWHVVRFKDRVPNFHCRVSLRDGRVMNAKVLNTSRENDLALIGIQPDDQLEHRFPPIAMGDSDTLMVGETVIAIGNPRGQANTVTAGVLSGVDRALSVTPPGEVRPIKFKELLQTDAAINPGNSGGALLDITGKLIGINTLMQLESQNIGFAIPVNHVRKIFDQQLLNVEFLGVWTGLELQETSRGLVVAKVAKGGPADRARVRRGDRILQVGDTRVRTKKEFARALVTYSAGQLVPLYVGGDGKAAWRRVRGWDQAAGTVFRMIGAATTPFDARRNRELYWRVHDSVYGPARGPLDPVQVESVQRDSPAADLGLRQGDLIVGSYDRWRNLSPLVNGNEALRNVLEAARGERAWISVYRPSEGLLHGRVAVR